jgi:hypothetical protein
MNPAELNELKATTSDIELVQCKSEAEAIEQAPGPPPAGRSSSPAPGSRA